MPDRLIRGESCCVSIATDREAVSPLNLSLHTQGWRGVQAGVGWRGLGGCQGEAGLRGESEAGGRASSGWGGSLEGTGGEEWFTEAGRQGKWTSCWHGKARACLHDMIQGAPGPWMTPLELSLALSCPEG